MDIRVMTIQDYDAVYALWMRSKNMGFNNLDDSREGVDRLLRRNPNTSFVAMDGDDLVGVILSGHDGRRGYIYQGRHLRRHAGGSPERGPCDRVGRDPHGRSQQRVRSH